jgi:hypothetical protein
LAVAALVALEMFIRMSRSVGERRTFSAGLPGGGPWHHRSMGAVGESEVTMRRKSSARLRVGEPSLSEAMSATSIRDRMAVRSAPPGVALEVAYSPLAT